MQQELFPKRKSKRKRLGRLERSLSQYDRRSFEERLDRLRYLERIFPKGIMFATDLEGSFIFDEIKMAFINGELVSTILLAQAFVERRLQLYFESKGLGAIGKKGLAAMVNHMRKNETMPEFIIGKIDALRNRRNPFVHLKAFDHEYNLNQRALNSVRQNLPKHPFEIIEADAKEALSLMYTITASMSPYLQFARGSPD